MIIDKTHRPWMVFCLAVLLAASACYLIYARAAAHGPTGGSWQGLLFGIIGSLLMLFAGLLPLRKKLPGVRLGSAQEWLRAHIWLGLLSVPFILFHAGFRWGGWLEQLLLLVFALVIGSGVVGVAFQHYLPRVVKASTPKEAMFEQIPAVCEALRRTADERVAKACGTLFQPLPAPASIGGAEDPEPEKELLRQFYVSTVRPFLSADANGSAPLGSDARAAALFAQLEQTLPARMHALLSELESICDERRQLARQIRLHYWLHLWLFVHLPLSAALLVLGVLHAVSALYY